VVRFRLGLYVVVFRIGVVLQLHKHRKMIGADVGKYPEVRQCEVLGVEGMVEGVPKQWTTGRGTCCTGRARCAGRAGR